MITGGYANGHPLGGPGGADGTRKPRGKAAAGKPNGKAPYGKTANGKGANGKNGNAAGGKPGKAKPGGKFHAKPGSRPPQTGTQPAAPKVIRKPQTRPTTPRDDDDWQPRSASAHESRLGVIRRTH